jgi:hypothetical protein
VQLGNWCQGCNHERASPSPSAIPGDDDLVVVFISKSSSLTTSGGAWKCCSWNDKLHHHLPASIREMASSCVVYLQGCLWMTLGGVWRRCSWNDKLSSGRGSEILCFHKSNSLKKYRF